MSIKKKILLAVLIIIIALVAFFFPKKSQYSTPDFEGMGIRTYPSEETNCKCLGYQPVIYDAPLTCFGLTYSCKCTRFEKSANGKINKLECTGK